MAVGKSLRFDVFARDGFTCQYCGRRPPDVVLELDHIHPVSKDGPDDILNLITACFDCNRGKAAKVISDIAPRLGYLRGQFGYGDPFYKLIKYVGAILRNRANGVNGRGERVVTDGNNPS